MMNTESFKMRWLKIPSLALLFLVVVVFERFVGAGQGLENVAE